MRKLFSLLVPALLVSSLFSSTPAEAATSPQRVVFEDTLSAGGSHSCAVTVAGLVRCWGNNGSDQTDVPSDLGAASQVSAGDHHSCAVTVAGLVRCWGYNRYGQTDVPSDLGVVSQVSSGTAHSCAVTVAGLVRCWGYNGSGRTDVPSDLGVVSQVSAGDHHSCAVTVAGLVRCWGNNWDGETDVPSDLGVVSQVSAGAYHSCAVTVAGLVRCWGYNGSGRTDVPSDLGVVSQVSAGAYHSCAVTVAGLVRCWGNNWDGETDVPSDLGVVSQVSAGAYHSCAVTVAGLVRCWGYNGYGQTSVPFDWVLDVLTSVSAGDIHSCAVTVAGLVRCWGYNGYGETDVPSDLGVVSQVSAGAYHSCAVTVAGLVRCWGYNWDGETDVPSDLGVVSQVSAGTRHSCAVTVAGLVRCWGNNGSGETDVPSDLGVVSQVSAGDSHSCAVTVAGLVRCWGYSGSGRTDVPSDLGVVSQVSSGTAHSCAVTVAGLVRCWGNNGSGETDVPSDLGVVSQVSAGDSHSCAVTVAGLVRCWGYNGYGETDVPSDLGVVSQVSGGAAHSCAVTVAGLVRCWGNNPYGQTSVDDTIASPIEFRQPKVLDVGAIEGAIVGETSSGSLVRAEFNLGESQLFYYQWYRDGLAISGSTQSTHKIIEDDLGAQLKVAVMQRSANKIYFGTASRIVEYPSLIFSQPSISGMNSVGSLLTAEVGNSDSEVYFSYQWLRNGEVISSATASQYRVGLMDLGKDLSVSVTGSKERFSSTTRISSVTGISMVIPNSPCAGTIDTTSTWLGTASQPGISGNPAFGQTLKGSNGVWASGTKFCLFWMTDGVIVPRASTSSLKLDGSTVGKYVQFVVVGIDKTSRRVARVSNPVLITKASFTNIKSPVVKGVAKVGLKLTTSSASWGTGTSYGYQWLRDSEEIFGATTSSYIPTSSDVGFNLTLRVCGSKQYFEQLCVESVPQIVSLGAISKVGQTSIRGTSTNVGATLMGSTTQWMTGVELSWQWLADGVEIRAATASTYTIARSDRGKTLSLRVTGDADGYQSVSKVVQFKKIP